MWFTLDYMILIKISHLIPFETMCWLPRFASYTLFFLTVRIPEIDNPMAN